MEFLILDFEGHSNIYLNGGRLNTQKVLKGLLKGVRFQNVTLPKIGTSSQS